MKKEKYIAELNIVDLSTLTNSQIVRIIGWLHEKQMELVHFMDEPSGIKYSKIYKSKLMN